MAKRCPCRREPRGSLYVNIGPDTMTQQDIDEGRLICVIGVAPVKPAEFVIFRITQKQVMVSNRKELN